MKKTVSQAIKDGTDVPHRYSYIKGLLDVTGCPHGVEIIISDPIGHIGGAVIHIAVLNNDDLVQMRMCRITGPIIIDDRRKKRK